jgi:hypothetical protein
VFGFQGGQIKIRENSHFCQVTILEKKQMKTEQVAKIARNPQNSQIATNNFYRKQFSKTATK